MLEIESLKKSFAEPNGQPLPILDVPKLKLSAGEQCVLLGQSGGGKTTLLHIIAGITRADSGIVRIDGTDITTLSELGGIDSEHRRSDMFFKPSICCQLLRR